MIHDRIDSNSAIMFGKPVIRGTRITVEHILRKLAGEVTIEEILTDHPHLTPGDVYAAAAFPQITCRKKRLSSPAGNNCEVSSRRVLRRRTSE